MKKTLLATVALLALSTAAHAQLTVDSPVADANAATSLLNEGTTLTNWTNQLQAMGDQLKKIDRAYDQASSFAGTFNHMPKLSSAESVLNMPQIGSPVTSDPMSATSLIAGVQKLSSGFGAAGSYANTNFQTNHVYTGTDASYGQQISTQNANSIANTQAMTQVLYASMAQRVPLVQSLEQQLAVATDPKDVMDLQARLQAEQVITASQVAQSQHLQTLYTLQQASMTQQRSEMMNQQIDNAIANAKAAGDGPDLFAAGGTSVGGGSEASDAANAAALSMSQTP